MTIKLGRYAVTYVLCVLALMALAAVLDIAAGIELPSGLSTVLPVLVAALLEGQRHARLTGEEISKSDAWKFARQTTLLVVGINLLFIAIFVLVVPDFLAVFAIIGPVGALILATILLVIVLLTNRFFVSKGASGELKNRNKQQG